MIQFLYFDECPSWKQALANLHEALAKMHWDPPIEIVEIQTDEQANQYEFQGSPSIKFNGVDLWPAKQEKYFLGCRVYHTPAGLRGVPGTEMLQERLQQVRPTER